MAPPRTLAGLAQRFRAHPGLGAKADLRLLAELLGATDWLTGPGDDAAALPAPGGPGFLLAAGEAIAPALVAADPVAAGIAAVVANVNDIAAMGGRTHALVDTIVGPEETAAGVLRGLRIGCRHYGVPLVGGHLTVVDGPAAVSAFALGHATRLLAATQAAPGQTLLVAACLAGHPRGDLPVFTSIAERGPDLAGDVALLPLVADRGDARAAKDISMAGLLGSLAMLLEPTRSGATIDLDRVPVPGGVGADDWYFVFPTFGFLLCCPPERAPACRAAFTGRGLACEAVGTLDGTGLLRARRGGDEVTLLDVREGVTGIGGPARG